MAALMPHTTPWSNALRGSSDGVKARQANTSATQAVDRPMGEDGGADRESPAKGDDHSTHRGE
jgi:hypothetical protein